MSFEKNPRLLRHVCLAAGLLAAPLAQAAEQRYSADIWELRCKVDYAYTNDKDLHQGVLSDLGRIVMRMYLTEHQGQRPASGKKVELTKADVEAANKVIAESQVKDPKYGSITSLRVTGGSILCQ